MLRIAILALLAFTASADYSASCEGAKCRVLESAMKSITDLQKSIDSSSPCSNFGVQADEICNTALESFAATAPPSTDDPTKSAIYDRKLSELETTLDAPLQVLYLKQLSLLRERALTKYKTFSRGSEVSEYEAMVVADDQFVKEAEEATRSGGANWDYTSERNSLQGLLSELASSTKKLVDVELKAASQQSTAMQYLQMQQQQIQQMQMQLYGGSSPWNVGFAYRLPDTNVNLQGSYQAGRWNGVLSCVPDEYASMLGPNGFVNGVGPGNVGVSVNMNL
ncbi:hypothetical protein TrVE_jg874 [Triparma verrucosa]|uniref:Uncharacterized protein n=2 Tax=Triparma TaxID=722752 RepID=A0A9W7AFH9_9STRA|nr:hypothetical protein TrST_g2378 [Triparma strigata]GMH91964.1 hypothetical protein TrVE_jg874 [Triparma verrucosa]